MRIPACLPATLILAASLLASGCPKKSAPTVVQSAPGQPAPAATLTRTMPANPPPQAMPAPVPASVAPDPINEMRAALQVATPEQHEGLSAVQTRMDQAIDAQVAAWKSAGHDVSLAADQKLDAATQEFAEKLRMLTLSSPEVWASAKHDTELSLQNVRSAFTGLLNTSASN